MEIISKSAFQQHQDNYLPAFGREAVVLHQQGQPVAVLISPQWFERLQDLEELVTTSLADSGLSVDSLLAG